MPQMAPLNWLSLFIMFSLIYMLFCILNYFNYTILYKKSEKSFSKKLNWKLNWKW